MKHAKRALAVLLAVLLALPAIALAEDRPGEAGTS